MTRPVMNDLIKVIETSLATFYDFHLQSRAADHLVSAEEMRLQGLQRPSTEQGRLFIVPDALDNDALFIGINFEDDIYKTLDNLSPLERLETSNLNAFCVVVEEISHFHLVVNRAAREQPVTRLELEWQAEIDKMLLSSHLLHMQANDAHVDALMLKLYDEAVIKGQDAELYIKATKLAVQFWKLFRSEQIKGVNPFYAHNLRSMLRKSYGLDLDSKLHKLTRAA